MTEVERFGAQVIAAANATKNGDQYASDEKARVKSITCKFVNGPFLYNLSATKISEERFITEPKRCTPKQVFKKDFFPMGRLFIFLFFGVAINLKKPTPIRSVSRC